MSLRATSALLVLSLPMFAACRGEAAKPASAETALAAPVAMASAPAAAAATPARPQSTTTGSVVETMNSGGYTYVRLKTATEEIRVAATEFPVKIGERLTVATDMPMRNYHSRTLNRDFPVVYFVPAVAREGQSLPVAPSQPGETGASATSAMLMGSHNGSAVPQAVDAPVGPVAAAPGGVSIADVFAKSKALTGKPVIVRGKVVKVNNGIMDRNWVHLQDGSGSAKAKTNDLTVTTGAVLAVGDVVTMKGVLATSKDFGAGYAYDAILEQATVTGQ